MELSNGSRLSTQELLEAQAHVWNQIFNFVKSMSLKCAIELGIPDIIHNHGQPMNLSKLADALPLQDRAKSDSLHRLMTILVHTKFFDKVHASDEDEYYWLTPSSRLLLTGEPLSVAPYALAVLDPLLVDTWHHMSAWFRNQSRSPFATAHCMNFWEKVGSDHRFGQVFNEGMASDSLMLTSALVNDCKQAFEGLKSVVDVGGGTGIVAKAIVDAFPELKVSVLELPHVIHGLQGTDRLTFVAGDMFQFIPPAHAIFLKWIMHDWNDEECVKILEKCKNAIPCKDKGGKVIIVDMVLGNQKDFEATETQLCFDMIMMVLVNGKERSEEDWAKLFYAAGFTSYKITPILGLRSLIEVFP